MEAWMHVMSANGMIVDSDARERIMKVKCEKTRGAIAVGMVKAPGMGKAPPRPNTSQTLQRAVGGEFACRGAHPLNTEPLSLSEALVRFPVSCYVPDGLTV